MLPTSATYIGEIIKGCYKKKHAGKLSVSDKIDKVITNRWAALPIFAVVMFIVYYVSVSTIGTWATDWANDGVFGDGWHLFGIGTKAYEKVSDDHTAAMQAVEAFYGIDTEADDFDAGAALTELKAFSNRKLKLPRSKSRTKRPLRSAASLHIMNLYR